MLDIQSDSPVNISLLSDRHKYPPQGLRGGQPGSTSIVALSDGTRLHPKSRIVLKPGETLHIHFPGGGGFGPPAERDPAAIKRDIEFGYVSQDAADKLYGVQNDR